MPRAPMVDDVGEEMIRRLFMEEVHKLLGGTHGRLRPDPSVTQLVSDFREHKS